MSPEQFLDAVFRHRAIAILRGQHQGRAAAAMEVAVGAGFRLLEFTVSTPGVATAAPGVVAVMAVPRSSSEVSSTHTSRPMSSAGDVEGGMWNTTGITGSVESR